MNLLESIIHNSILAFLFFLMAYPTIGLAIAYFIKGF